MNREDRAKQFLPFDAMKGLQAALERQEEISSREERAELGEDDVQAISDTLASIRRGDRLFVEFYREGHYLTLSGEVTALDPISRTLTLSDTNIRFEDIYRAALRE